MTPANNTQKTIVSLFDYTGNMVQPWAEAGHKCYVFDIQHEGQQTRKTYPSGGFIQSYAADLSDPKALKEIAGLSPDLIFSFPPCTDLAGSGAKHFAKKELANPEFQREAVELARTALDLSNILLFDHGKTVPWIAENPISVLSTKWRKPDHIFNPCDYGGYLSEREAAHPEYPEIIPARDAYTKKTCIWAGRGFIMPSPRPVEPQTAGTQGTTPLHALLGGKSQRTKNIRSATPRGFAKAVFEANALT